MRVVLTGFMGTGKSAVGHRVADRLARCFVDPDAVIERNAGCSVREIFARDGEARFRDLERAAVAEAVTQPDAVVATGGGALLDERNRAALSRDGLLVCLVAAPSAIARRVRATAADRPLLRGAGNLTARIRDLMAEREPVYSSVPLRIDTTGLSVEQVADRVIAALHDAERPASSRRRGSAGPRGGGAPPTAKIAPRTAAR